MSWFNYAGMNHSSLVSATVLIIIVGNPVFILVALTQSVVIWFTWIVNLISDSDVCWQLLALIVGVNPISWGWLILI